MVIMKEEWKIMTTKWKSNPIKGSNKNKNTMMMSNNKSRMMNKIKLMNSKWTIKTTIHKMRMRNIKKKFPIKTINKLNNPKSNNRINKCNNSKGNNNNNSNKCNTSNLRNNQNKQMPIKIKI